jgi:hypothetical protein
MVLPDLRVHSINIITKGPQPPAGFRKVSSLEATFDLLAPDLYEGVGCAADRIRWEPPSIHRNDARSLSLAQPRGVSLAVEQVLYTQSIVFGLIFLKSSQAFYRGEELKTVVSHLILRCPISPPEGYKSGDKFMKSEPLDATSAPLNRRGRDCRWTGNNRDRREMCNRTEQQNARGEDRKFHAPQRTRREGERKRGSYSYSQSKEPRLSQPEWKIKIL